MVRIPATQAVGKSGFQLATLEPHGPDQYGKERHVGAYVPGASMNIFLTLPVELIADILSELDLESLIKISYLSRRLHDIVSDSSLNPWRKPILRSLYSENGESALKHLSVRRIVPRHNFIEILSLASPTFILHEATLPNLKSEEWEECFYRRFLPGWRKWHRDGSWKATYLECVDLFHFDVMCSACTL